MQAIKCVVVGDGYVSAISLYYVLPVRTIRFDHSGKYYRIKSTWNAEVSVGVVNLTPTLILKLSL